MVYRVKMCSYCQKRETRVWHNVRDVICDHCREIREKSHERYGVGFRVRCYGSRKNQKDPDTSPGWENCVKAIEDGRE